MMEGNETHGPGDGAAGGGWGPEGRQRGEADLLAERRARRAAESPEHILVRRAETAEATVRTLEAHVASLQQRLRDAQEEWRRAADATVPGGGPAGGSLAAQGADQPSIAPGPGGVQAGGEGPLEAELRRARQREYAEQRLREETEERLIEAERDSRAQLERLSRQLSESEAQERVLAARVETLQRDLVEAEQSVAAERDAARRAEGALGEKVAELEAQAAELRRELQAERAARLRAEETIEALRLGHRRLELIAQELRAGMSELRAAAAAQPVAPEPASARQWTEPGGPGPAPAGAPIRERVAAASPASPRAGNGEMVEALAAAVERLRARVAEDGQAPPPSRFAPPRHKHSLSLIGRWRLARKQRRGR